VLKGNAFDLKLKVDRLLRKMMVDKIAEGAISGGKAAVFCQRVEEALRRPSHLRSRY
jgi:hypothetical protein